MKILYLLISLSFLLALAYCPSHSAPYPPGNTIEITAKVISITEHKTGKKVNMMNPTPEDQALISQMRRLLKIKIIKIGKTITKSRYPKMTVYRDKYFRGQILEVMPANKPIIKPGMIAKGTIYSMGDEWGDFYVFTVK